MCGFRSLMNLFHCNAQSSILLTSHWGQTHLWGQSLQIFWSANEPPITCARTLGWLRAFRASSKLSTRELKNSRASCCSLKLTGSPHSLQIIVATFFYWKRQASLLMNQLDYKSTKAYTKSIHEVPLTADWHISAQMYENMIILWQIGREKKLSHWLKLYKIKTWQDK